MIFRFQGIVFDTSLRELRRDGDQMAIEPKAFDLLEYLIAHRERVVTKEELIERVWSGRFVSDSAVSSAIKAVRQAVGDSGREQRVIRTAFGRGFRFVAELEDHADDKPDPPDKGPVAEPARPKGKTNLKPRRRALIGRNDEFERIHSLLRDNALVSIVGPGGAGKTSLAQEVGHQAVPDFEGGVWFCDLVAADASQVQSSVLGALDQSAGAGPVDGRRIADRLGDAPTLLIFDNCEHLVDAAASLAEELIELMPQLTILVTSREALEVRGEKVLRISGLSYDSGVAPAVWMFRHCASDIVDLPETRENNEIIRKITERLEGLPLAIELAAPRLVSNTPNELLEALDDQLSVLASRRRQQNARHTAINDAIAWSYNLLKPDEQRTLVDLSIFAGAFTMRAAMAVCEAKHAKAALHRLVEKSMVTFLPGTPTSRFKLLEPIRQFAERERDATETDALAERHARWFAARMAELAKDMRGSREIAACEALTDEWPDCGRALAWGRAAKRAEIAIDPLVALKIHLLWQLRIEGFGWLEAGVEACGISDDRIAATNLVRAIGAWSANELDRSEALMEQAVAAGGETVETSYFKFYQGFAREDFEKVVASGELSREFALAMDDPSWRIQSTAFLICGLSMLYGDTPRVPELFAELRHDMDLYEWPSGQCCELIAKVVSSFGRRDSHAMEEAQRDIVVAADRCHTPWFKVTAGGLTSRNKPATDEALALLDDSCRNVRDALSSGDVIQLPTVLRVAAVRLTDLGLYRAAAKLMGLIPHIRGLGEKGSLAPHYEGATRKVENELGGDELENLLAEGSSMKLDTALELLETEYERLQEGIDA